MATANFFNNNSEVFSFRERLENQIMDDANFLMIIINHSSDDDEL